MVGVLTKLAYVSLKKTLPAYLPVASTSSHVLDWASRHAQSPSIPTKTKTKTKKGLKYFEYPVRTIQQKLAKLIP